MVPDLDRVDPVPGRGLAGLQQIVDRGDRAAPARRRRRAEGLAIMAAFGMRLQPVACDNVVGIHRRPPAGPSPPEIGAGNFDRTDWTGGRGAATPAARAPSRPEPRAAGRMRLDIPMHHILLSIDVRTVIN